MRRMLSYFGGMFALAFGALRRQPRSRLALVGAALCLLALTGTILLALAHSASPNTAAIDPATASRVLTTETATFTATATRAATATKTTLAPQTTGSKKTTSGVKDQFVAPPSLPPPAPATPTATPCPTATPFPTATSTTGASPSPSGSPGGGTSASYRHAMSLSTRPQDCTPCGTVVTPGPTSTPDAATIKGDLTSAAQTYGLPPNLLYAEAYQESQWDPTAMACDGGVGLMQIQYYNITWLNNLSSGSCDGIAIKATSYDAYTAQGSADLGAKYLRWLKCLYEYNAPSGGTASAPVNGGSEYDYFHYNPALPYPDTTLHGQTLPDCPTSGGATGTATPTPQAGSCSLCQSILDDNTNGPTATTYQDLQDPQGVNSHWSCPFDPANGTSDFELLDVTISAYNEGPGNLATNGITNIGYVGSVEYWLTKQPWSAWA